MGSTRRWATNVAVATLSLAIALVAGEVAWRVVRTRTYGPATNPDFVLFDARHGWRYRPGARVRHATPDFDVDIRIDEAGRRVGLPPTSPRPAIVFVGDSMTFGWGVRGEEAFPSLVGAALGGTAWNLGVAGFGSDQELLRLRADGLPLRPDAVVVAYTANDVEDVLASRRYGRTKPRFDVVDDALVLRPPAAGFVERHSSFYRSLVYFAGMRLAVPLDDEATGRGRDLVRRLLATMAAETHAAGSRFLLVVEDAPWLADLPGAIDVGPALAASAEPVVFASDPHWNAAGHRAVAGAVTAALRPPRASPR